MNYSVFVRRVTPILFVLLTALPVRAQTPNDMARFLAGMEPSAGSPLAAAAQTPGWQQHAKAMNASWGAFETNIITRIRVWAKANLPSSPPAMLYMFGGPDFPHADAFFPDSKVFVLSGLEPVGNAPAAAAVAGPKLSKSLGYLRRSMEYYFNYGYFITAHMLTNLKAGEFVGTMPLLSVFLVRSGNAIDNVEFLDLNADGSVVAAGGKKRPRAVRITYHGSDGAPRQLYYFSTDLSNGGVAKSGFLQFCAKQGPAGSLAKSASYLYHNGGFSKVREFVLKQSQVIVQDDTGTPFRLFKSDAWKLRAFGRYVPPIPVFKGHYQRDMAAFFARGSQPLNFTLGYQRHVSGTSLLVAEKAGAQ